MIPVRNLLFFLAAVLGTSFFAFRYPFFFDDAFIAFRIGENFWKSGRPYFQANEAAYTSTSLLYPFWNALLAGLGSGREWFRISPFLNGIFLSLAAAVCLKRADSPAFQPLPFLFSAALLLTLLWDFKILCFGNSGLETGLYMAFLATALLPGMEKKRQILLASLGVWIRPDGILALLATSVRRPSIRNWIGAAFLAGASLLLAGFFYGTLVPQSFLAKINHNTDRYLEIQKGLGYLFFAGKTPLLLLFGLAVFLAGKEVAALLPLLLWMGLYLLAFSVGASWWPWYLPPLMVGFWFLCAWSVTTLWRHPLPFGLGMAEKWIKIGVLSLVLLAQIHEAGSGIPALERASDAYRIRENSCREIARVIRNRVPAEKAILLEQIGLIGYFSQARILDYPGLANPEMARFLRSRGKKIPSRMTDPEINAAILKRFSPEFVLCSRVEWEAWEKVPEWKNRYRLDQKMAYYPEDPRSDSVWLYRREDGWGGMKGK